MYSLLKNLNIKQYPSNFKEVFDNAINDYQGDFFVDKSYILDLNKKYDLFSKHLNDVLNAAEKIRKNKDLKKFIWVLRYAMKDKDNFPAFLSELDLPVANPGEDTMPFDFAPLFSFLLTIEDSFKALRSRNVPEDVCVATHKAYERCLDIVENHNGKLGFDKRHVNWMQHFVNSQILQIGRLQFEIGNNFFDIINVFKNSLDEIKILMVNTRLHSSGMILGSCGCENEEGSYDANFIETEEYYEGYPVLENYLAGKERERLPKSDWKLVLSSSDAALSVHIPPTDSLNEEICIASYNRAIEIFKNCYPEYNFKAFMCYSWMLEPELERLLSPTSNIVQFQKKYIRFPHKCSGQDVFYFVFLKSYENYHELPENSSLERAIKQHLLQGNFIHETGGFMFI